MISNLNHLKYRLPMCGRFALTLSSQELLKKFPGSPAISWEISYNIAPQQMTPILVSPAALSLAKWGFHVPNLNKLIINARAESVSDKALFQRHWPKNRCAVVTSGFFEWKGKTPHFIQKKDEELLLMGGVYRFIQGRPEYVIMTQDAVGPLKELHQRKPIMFSIKDLGNWFSGGCGFEAPLGEELLSIHQVSKEVNKAAYNHPNCIQKENADDDPDLFLDLR